MGSRGEEWSCCIIAGELRTTPSLRFIFTFWTFVSIFLTHCSTLTATVQAAVMVSSLHTQIQPIRCVSAPILATAQHNDFRIRTPSAFSISLFYCIEVNGRSQQNCTKSIINLVGALLNYQLPLISFDNELHL